MFEFLTELSSWLYLVAASVVTVFVIALAINPAATLRFMLRKDKKTS
jgi:hypothetical protein